MEIRVIINQRNNILTIQIENMEPEPKNIEKELRPIELQMRPPINEGMNTEDEDRGLENLPPALTSPATPAAEVGPGQHRHDVIFTMANNQGPAKRPISQPEPTPCDRCKGQHEKMKAKMRFDRPKFDRRRPYRSACRVPVPGFPPKSVITRRKTMYVPNKPTVIRKVEAHSLTHYGLTIKCYINKSSTSRKMEHYDYLKCMNSLSALKEYLDITSHTQAREPSSNRKKDTSLDLNPMQKLISHVNKWVGHEEHLGLCYKGTYDESRGRS